MKPRTLWSIRIAIVVACSGIAAVIFHQYEAPSPSKSSSLVRRSSATVEPATTVAISPTTPPVVIPVLTTPKPTPRQRFRKAKDYAELVKALRPQALAGNAEAQYVTAEALRWCGQTLKLYFIRPNGQTRTLDEIQARRAEQPAGISQEELSAIYTRCQAFLKDPDLFKSAGSWDQWLDKAVAANYPAAMAEKARLLEADISLATASQLPNGQPKAGAEDYARALALTAVQSGDPAAIFFMSDWVHTDSRTPEENATLISAWRILACQKGYDCGPESDFLKSVCDQDVQCADGQSYTDYFQRQLGTQYDDALSLAKTIDQAIAAKDVQAIRSHL